MILTILLISISSFVVYFYVIGLWYIGLIPLLFFLITMIYYISGISFKSKANSLFNDYGLFLAWLVILLGLFLVLKFFGIDTTNSFLFLLSLNLLLWFGSYIFKYNDGKIIAQIGYYSSVLGLTLSSWVLYGFSTFFSVFSHIWILTLVVVSFIVLIIGIKYFVEKYLNYTFFILVCGAIGLSLYHNIQNIYIFLITSVLLLSFLYIYIYYILSNRPPSEKQIKEISVRRILAGERVLKNNSQGTDLSKKIYLFISQTPNLVKYFLEGVNTLIILILIYLYFKNALTLQGSIEQIFYRFVMVGFIVNVFLLKRINYTSVFQRLLTFLVINFAIYISLFSAFKGDIVSIVFLGILRNIVSTMMVFHIHKTKLGEYLRKVDYLFWIFTTMLALSVNIVLLFHTDIVLQLLFPIILLYVGVQGIMLFYSIKYINKIKEIELDKT